MILAPRAGSFKKKKKKKQTFSAGQFEFHSVSCAQDTSSPTRPKSTADLFIVLVLQTAPNLQSKETRNSTGMANFQNLQRGGDFFPPPSNKNPAGRAADAFAVTQYAAPAF